MAENVPNLKKETDIQAQETEGPKQGKSKQTYTRQDLFLHRNTAGRKGMARCIQSPEREKSATWDTLLKQRIPRTSKN